MLVTASCKFVGVVNESIYIEKGNLFQFDLLSAIRAEPRIEEG